MDQGFMVTVRKLAIPFMLVALVIGIGLGLLLAWQVWPVQWYDTDPSDLRMGHQKEYVVMVANSFLVTGDADAGRTQLYALTDDDTSWAQVVDFVGRRRLFVASRLVFRLGGGFGVFRIVSLRHLRAHLAK